MVDIGLTAETEMMTSTSRYVRPSTSEIPTTRAATARSILRVTPHVAQRPLTRPTPALKSLLTGAQLSHYNYMKGSIRTPTKQDYFHEKTLIYNFLPSFRASYFAHAQYQLPPALHKVISESQIPPRKASKPSTAHSRKRFYRHSPSKSASKLPASTFKLSPPLSKLPTSSSSHFHLTDFSKVNRPKPRPIICIEDGQSLNEGNIRTYSIDFLDYVQKYIGFVPNPNPEPLRKDEISLKNQALLELFEKANANLRPEKPFTAVFMIDGRKIEDLTLVPMHCRVLVFSSDGEFKGVTEGST